MSTFTSLLNQEFDLYSPVRTSDGQGGHQLAFLPEGSVMGQMSPKSGAERINARQEQRREELTFYVEASVNISREWVVFFGEKWFEVLGVHNPRTANHHLEVDCFALDEPILNGVILSLDLRTTEGGDVRITEDGFVRVLE